MKHPMPCSGMRHVSCASQCIGWRVADPPGFGMWDIYIKEGGGGYIRQVKHAGGSIGHAFEVPGELAEVGAEMVVMEEEGVGPEEGDHGGLAGYGIAADPRHFRKIVAPKE